MICEFLILAFQPFMSSALGSIRVRVRHFLLRLHTHVSCDAGSIGCGRQIPYHTSDRYISLFDHALIGVILVDVYRIFYSCTLSNSIRFFMYPCMFGKIC